MHLPALDLLFGGFGAARFVKMSMMPRRSSAHDHSELNGTVESARSCSTVIEDPQSIDEKRRCVLHYT